MRGKFLAFKRTTVRRAAPGCQHNEMRSSPRVCVRTYSKLNCITYFTKWAANKWVRIELPSNSWVGSLCSRRPVDSQFDSDRDIPTGTPLHRLCRLVSNDRSSAQQNAMKCQTIRQTKGHRMWSPRRKQDSLCSERPCVPQMRTNRRWTREDGNKLAGSNLYLVFTLCCLSGNSCSFTYGSVTICIFPFVPAVNSSFIERFGSPRHRITDTTSAFRSDK